MALIQDSTDPRFLSQYAGVSSPGASASPTTTNIPADEIKPGNKMVIPGQDRVPLDYASMIAGTGVSLPSQVSAEESAYKKQQQDVLAAMGEFGDISKYQQELESSPEVVSNQNEISRLQKSLISLNAESAARQIKLENQPIVSSIASGQQAQEEKLRAIKAMEISSYIQAAQGNLALANDKIDRAIKLRYEDQKLKLETLNKQLEFNRDAFTASEKKRADALTMANNERLRLIEQQEVDEKEIYNVGLLALKYGADTATVQRIQQAKTPEEAIAIGGTALQDPMAKLEIEKTKLDNAIKRAQLKKIQVETTLLGDDNNPVSVNVSGNVTKEMGEMLKVVLASGKFNKDQVKSITSAINNGEDPLTVIKNQAKNIMGQTQANEVSKFENARNSMLDLKSAISEYYTNGGKTGIFSGNIEKAINNLGQVKDPKLVSLATQIAAQLQVYRNAVSGTAYSIQEGAEISSVFPGINKSQGLNDAIINGRIASLDSSINGAYKNTLGSSYQSVIDSQKAAKESPMDEAAAKAKVLKFLGSGNSKAEFIANFAKTPNSVLGGRKPTYLEMVQAFPELFN